MDIEEIKNKMETTLLDYDQVKEHLYVRLTTASKSGPRLREMPHIDQLDLRLICCFEQTLEEEYTGSAEVNRYLMEQWGVDKETLFAQAMANTVRDKPAEVLDISRVADPLHIFAGTPERDHLYAVTNTAAAYGAVAIFYPGMLKQMAEVLGGSYYVIPSSIHEMILMRDGSEYFTTDGLEELVHEINTTQLPPRDVLSDTVYYYDCEKESFITAKEK